MEDVLEYEEQQDLGCHCREGGQGNLVSLHSDGLCHGVE